MGGVRPYNTNLQDPSVLFAMESINNFYAQKGDNSVRTVVSIVSATRQVVAGTLYRYKLEVTGGEQNELCTLAVWSRPWLGANKQNVIQGEPQCEPKSIPSPKTSVPMPGGERPVEASLKDPNVIFAVNGINEHFQQHGDNSLRTAVRILSATSQVVEGSMHRYKIEINGGSQPEVCNVAVWSRPWLKSSDKLILQDVNCKDKTEFLAENAIPAPKTSVPKPGGQMPIEASLEDPKVIFAVNGINEHFQQNGDNALRTAVRILSATSQVVQGSIQRYEIEINGGTQPEVCNVAVWSRPWLNSPDKLILQDINCKDKKEVPLPAPNMPVGGTVPFETNLQNPDVVFAVNEINEAFQKSGDNDARTAVKLLSATVKVVAGALFEFTIEVTGGHLNEECTVSVWSRPWLQGTEKTQLYGEPKCHALERRELALGAEEEISLEEEEVRNAYVVLGERVNAEDNGPSYLVGTSAEKVTKQVVNGILYNFTNIKFYKSSCTKAEEAAADENQMCTVELNEAKPVTVCTATVWYNPRQLPVYQLTDYQCQ